MPASRMAPHGRANPRHDTKAKHPGYQLPAKLTPSTNGATKNSLIQYRSSCDKAKRREMGRSPPRTRNELGQARLGCQGYLSSMSGSKSAQSRHDNGDNDGDGDGRG